jgi:hypothetical protein
VKLEALSLLNTSDKEQFFLKFSQTAPINFQSGKFLPVLKKSGRGLPQKIII